MHIVLAMKPLDGNFAENAIKHGVAGLNVDAGRIGYCDEKDKAKVGTGQINAQRGITNTYKTNSFTASKTTFNPNPTSDLGRFPANVVLGHSEGCVSKGVRKVKGHKGYPNGPGGIWSKDYQEEHQNATGMTQTSTINDNKAWTGHAGEDGKEEVEDWECVEGCPVRVIGEQSGDLKSGKLVGKYRGGGWKGIFQKLGLSEKGFEANTGTASRFFKQVNELKGDKYDRDDESGRVS